MIDIAVNSVSNRQTVPTAVFDWNGTVKHEAEIGGERIFFSNSIKRLCNFSSHGKFFFKTADI